MFTGIIQAIGRVEAIKPMGLDTRLLITSDTLDVKSVAIGDSIAVNGVCLTATAMTDNGFWVDVSSESLATTSLQSVQAGDPLNLEKALTLATPLGGHLVSGHVDGLGEILAVEVSGRASEYQIRLPKQLAKYVAAKGSVCIDGVSLTVNQVCGAEFSVMIIPHTQEKTIIKHYQKGTRVNIEIDLLARYLERLLLGDKAAEKQSQLSESFLKEHGFINRN